MVGYPGAGKTTVSKIIHEATGAVHLWADKIRNERFPNPTHSHEENLQLYSHLNEVAAELLAAGQDVIFDTNFNYFKDRQHMRDIADAHSATAKLIWITTPKDIAKERATLKAQNQDTRIWGNMPIDDFERISNKLEEPRPDENVIKIDGTRITSDYVRKLLNI